MKTVRELGCPELRILASFRYRGKTLLFPGAVSAFPLTVGEFFPPRELFLSDLPGAQK